MRLKEFIVNAALQGMGDDRLKKYLQASGYVNPTSDLVIFKHDIHKALYMVLDNWGKRAPISENAKNIINKAVSKKREWEEA